MTRINHIDKDQHFLTSTDVATRVIDAAKIKKTDIVFEAGTGAGALVQLMCNNAAHVISVERDENLYNDACINFAKITNLELVCDDAFSMTLEYDVFVSALPYSQSRHALEWMIQQRFDRGVIIVQKEFANKLSPVHLEDRRAISVLTNAAFKIKHVSNVNRQSFSPSPHVDSVILALSRRKTLDVSIIRAINLLFSYRRKTLRSALRRLGVKNTLYDSARLEELQGDEIVKIAQIIKS